MRTTILLMWSCIVTLVIASLAVASVPPMISYQGKLMQPNGTPVPDGEYKMAFAIYGQPTGGTALWSEVNEHVRIKGGLYSVLLGSVINLPANIFDAPDRFFGVKIGDDPEMMPRQQIASVGFAVKSASADTAKNADIAATVLDGAIGTEKIADGAVTAGKLAETAVTTGKLADGSVTSGKIADGAVGASKIAPGAIALAYALRTSDFSTSASTWVQVPGLTATVTLPPNGRLAKITVWCSSIQNLTGGYALLSIWDGPVNTGTMLARTCANTSANGEFPASVMALLPASPGTHTFNVGLLRVGGGDAYMAGPANSPAFILVEVL